MTDDSVALERAATEHRLVGRYADAVECFAAAAAATTDLVRRVNMLTRQAVCLGIIERFDESLVIAQEIITLARTEGLVHELMDALGIVADYHNRTGSLAEEVAALSEALDLSERLPADPAQARANHLALHNLAATLEPCGFVQQAIELFQRALVAATTPSEAEFTRASLVTSLSSGAALANDEAERDRMITAGLRQLDDLDRDNVELHAMTSAAAHGSLLLVRSGRYGEALELARSIESSTREFGLREDATIAKAAALISVWRLAADASILDEVEAVIAAAAEMKRSELIAPLEDVHLDILWSLGRLDDARQTFQDRLLRERHRTAAERAARWKYIQLGVEHLRVSAISDTDPLTGLHNRRHLDRVLPSLLAESTRILVAVLDLDGFKRVNDELGYARGDAVICEVADLLEGVCRRSDVLVRLGGDEFVVALRDIDDYGAMKVFERMRQLISDHSFQGIPDHIRLSASVGVLTLQAGHELDLRGALAHAATAMQEAKRSGKDRVHLVTVGF